jgi:hypothetical protein
MAADNRAFVVLAGHGIPCALLRELNRAEDTTDSSADLVIGTGQSRCRLPIHVNAMLGASEVLTLVICSDIDAITPAVAALDEDLLAVGTDSTVFLLSTLEKRIRRTITLSTPFRGFLSLTTGGLVVIEEGGLQRLRPGGHSIWNVNTDLIDTIKLQGEVLVVNHFDAPPMAVRLDDGVTRPIQ